MNQDPSNFKCKMKKLYVQENKKTWLNRQERKNRKATKVFYKKGYPFGKIEDVSNFN
jgi:hypothetical protein